MQLRPVIAALRRHRVATALIVLQVAMTLAIVCNALYVAHQRVVHLLRPTGLDDAAMLVVHNQWLDAGNVREVDSSMSRDLDLLRSLPGVVDAYADYSYPAAGPFAQLVGIRLEQDQSRPTSLSESYYADDHALATLGVRMLAGRNFRADEIGALRDADALPSPASILVTKDLADALFPSGNALGKAVYVGDKPSTIIGIISNVQVPAVNTNRFAYRSVLLPYRLASASDTYYMVRVLPGQMAEAKAAATKALLAADRMRVLDVQRYSDLRAAAYAPDYGMATLMSLICAILLGATGAGIFGLSSFWVAQRRKQIGVRRALGATRGDILRYFQTENFMIVSFGIMFGAVLAIALNLVLMQYYELPRLPFFYLPIGAVALWALGQLAVLHPALRAAAVPPVVATRTV
jgi:putative ABC transport system permease protein